MKTRFSALQKILAAALALVLVLGLIPVFSSSVTAVSSDSSLSFVPGSKVADDPTLNEWTKYFGPNKMDTEFAGAVWTDKSVFSSANASLLPGVSLSDPNNFLVALSAIAANSVITGQTTVPTDTMLVLDLSGSMLTEAEFGPFEDGDYIDGVDVSSVQAMVTATNAAIAELMTQNPNNRVGVVLYSGNTSTGQNATTDSAAVVLPLGSYQGVTVGTGANAHLEYLSLDVNTRTETIYERVSSGRFGNRWEATDETVTFVTGDVSVSVKNGLKTASGATVTDRSKQVVGGTYIQNGLFQAWKEFEKVTDTVVPEGLPQAGTERLPVVVLMSDGAPTIATTDYTNVGTSNTGNGGSNQNTSTMDRITLLTQLTAAYIKGAIADHYTESEGGKQDVVFLTLGFGTSENASATATLYPAGSNTTLAGYWNTYLRAAAGSNVTVISGNNGLTLRRNGLVEAMNYVDTYYYASNADELVDSFDRLVGEILLKAAHYNTLVIGDNPDLSGYVSIEDELGDLIEVATVKGILLGNTLYTGKGIAEGMNTGKLGTTSSPTERGDEFIRTVRERIPGLNTTQAQQLVDRAYNDQQLYYTDDSNWSNYIGWYADENGSYAGFWDKDYGYANAPANAVYANKSYGYLGVNGDSDMMHVVVLVRTNLKTLHQTVFFKIPAALIPTVTYNVSLAENNLSVVEEFTRTGADPMRLVFEVGPRSDLNSVNLAEKIDAFNIAPNSDGSYTLYTNAWTVGNDANGNGIPDPDEVDSAVVTEAHFQPAKENSRFYYTEDDLLLDASGNPVTGAKPSGEGYYHTLHIYGVSGVTDKRIPVSPVTVAKARQNSAGQWYIPEGTPYLEYTRFRSLKGGDANEDGFADRNLTNTLDYYFYPAAFANDAGSDVYMFLGNNGTFTVRPATGITLTKKVNGVIDGGSSYTFTVTLSGIPEGAAVAPVITDANGAPIEGISSTAYENGSFQVTMPADVTAYITGIPAGTSVSIAEQISGDYVLSGISVDGVAQTVSNPISVTVPAASAGYLDVTFTNTPNGYGNLVISKDVNHPYEIAPDALAEKEFFFQVILTGSKISVGDTFATSVGTDVKVGENGVVTFTDGKSISLFDGESITIFDIPEGSAYTVSEPEGTIPQGFMLETVNGSDVAEVSGTIDTNGTDTAAFVNRYPDNYVSITVPIDLSITKVLEGDPANAEDFVFVLQGLIPGTENYPTIEEYTINSDASDKTVADSIELKFDAPGTYHYRIVEVLPDVPTPGMTYSTTRALFVIEVTDTDMNGVLDAVVREEANIDVEESTDGYAVSASFTNVYAVHSTNVQVNVHKDLTNNTGVNIPLTRFRFGLFAIDADGNATGDPIQTITTSALGDATFSIRITEHEDLVYIIKELIPEGVDSNYTLNGMTYDPAAYKLSITVEADQDGQLSAQTSIVLIGSEDAGEAQVVFRNTYALKETSASFSLGKTLTGRSPKEEETFQFYLVRTDATFRNVLTGNNAWNATYTLPANFSSVVSLDYTRAGTYHYRLTEIIPTGELNGLTYDPSEYHITITVSDNGDGTLVASTPVIRKLGAVDPVPEVHFTNTYTVTGSGSVVIDGTKVMDGRNLYTGGFQFGLYNADANGNPVGEPIDVAENRPDGTFVFDALHYDVSDLGEGYSEKVYTYCVKELVPAEAVNNQLNGVTYDTTVHKVTVTVSHDSNGNLTVTPSANYSESITIRNIYVADSVTATIHGSKALGGDWSAVADKTFTFELYEANENFEVTNTTPVTTTVNGSGSFSFSKTYADGQEGFYYYVLREDTSAEAGGVSYDASIYQVTVNVTDPGTGKLSAIVSMYHPGTGSVASDAAVGAPVATFHNTYAAEPAKLTFGASKVLTGRDLRDGEFSFGIFDAEDVLIEVATNTGNSIAFSEIVFTAPGTYTYTFRELAGTANGIIYDNDEYVATVVVKDNGEGMLYVDPAVTFITEVTLDEDGEVIGTAKTESIEFRNTFDPGKLTVPVVINKVVVSNSEVTISPEGFQFELLDAEGTVLGTVTSDATGKAAFGIDYTLEDVGQTYTYKLRERNTYKAGVTYSTAVHTVEVTVSLDESDALVASFQVNGTAASAASVEFVNQYDAPETPDTGDHFDLVLCTVVLLISAVALVALVILKKKKSSVK